MDKVVKKVNNGITGEVVIPSDKSISHRAIMLSSLAKGKSIIKNFSKNNDCKTTLNVFKNLGIDINYLDNTTLSINSLAGLKEPAENLYCANSGTTIRLVSGILAAQKFSTTLTGDESLSKRPMKRIIEPLSLMGADIKGTDNHAPIYIKGCPLTGIEYNSKISSAQVKSSILLAGIHANGKTIYTEPYKSRNHTEIMLKYMGANIETNDNTVIVSESTLTPQEIEIPGDISSAAFFIAAALITPKSNILIKNVGINPTRTGILDIVKRMGGNVEILNKRIISGEEVGDIKVSYTPDLKPCTIEKSDIPLLIDEIPVIALIMAKANGISYVKDAQDLRNKESDRISCLVSELKHAGCKIEETPDGFIIEGGDEIQGGCELDSHYDHRIAMSLYVMGLNTIEEILIKNFEWINISFPEFEELFAQII